MATALEHFDPWIGGRSDAVAGREVYELISPVDGAVVSKIVDVVSVPVIADTDTGYGNAINVIRTHVPWMDRSLLRRGASDEEFRDMYGRGLNALMPEIDLLTLLASQRNTMDLLRDTAVLTLEGLVSQVDQHIGTAERQAPMVPRD